MASSRHKQKKYGFTSQYGKSSRLRHGKPQVAWGGGEGVTVPPAVGVLRWRFGASRKIIFRLFLQLASHQSNPNVRNFLPVGDLRPASICSKGAVTRVVVTKVNMSRLSQLGARGRDQARFSGSPGLRSPFAVLDSPVRVPSVCPPSAVVSIATVLGGQPRSSI